MSNRKMALGALLFVCIAWGTTYLAIKIGVAYIPPFLFAGIRQIIAGIILAIVVMVMGKKVDWSAKNLLMQSIVGILLIAGGNGLVTYGEQNVPSGLAALICAMSPMFSVILSYIFIRSEKINWVIVLGIILGFIGVAINFKDSFTDVANQAYFIGIIIVLIAAMSWSIGSIVSKTHKPKVNNPLANSAMQVTAGGFVLLLCSPLSDNFANMDFWNINAIGSLVYLIVIGSVLGFSAYLYALKHLPIGTVMIYAYINPLVAVILGALLYNETINLYTILSFICIMLGVFLVNFGYGKLSKSLK